MARRLVRILGVLSLVAGCSDDGGGGDAMSRGDGGSSHNGGSFADGGNAGSGGSGGNGGSGSGGSGGDDSAEAEITPEDGGTVMAAGAQVDVPPGAVEEAVTLTVEQVDAAGLAALPAGRVAAGPVIALLPHGTTFAEPVQITVPHDAGSDSTLQLLRLDDEDDTAWEVVEGATFDDEAAHAESSTFSLYCATQADGQQSQNPMPGADAGAGGGAGATPTRVVQLRGDSGDDPFAMAIDADGNVLVAGQTLSTFGDLDGDGVIDAADENGNNDGFVAKLDPQGALLWVHIVRGSTGEIVTGVDVDPDGNVYAAGYFQGTLPVDGMSLGSGGGDDIFVRKLTPAGVEDWTAVFGNASVDQASGIVVDAGFAYVVGFTVGEYTGATAVGSNDVFVHQFALDGTPGWVQQYGSTGVDFSRGIAVDGMGKLVIAGTTDGALSGETNAGMVDAFVMRLEPADGGIITATQFGGPVDDQIWDIAADDAGNVFLAMLVEEEPGLTFPFPEPGQGSLVRLDSSLAMVWEHLIGGAEAVEANAVAVAADGRIAVVGTTSVPLDGLPVANTAGDAFLRLVDADGQALSTALLGGADGERGKGVAFSGSEILMLLSTRDTLGDLIVQSEAANSAHDVAIAWYAD